MTSMNIPNTNLNKYVISIGININVKPFEKATCLKDIIQEEYDVIKFRN